MMIALAGCNPIMSQETSVFTMEHFQPYKRKASLSFLIKQMNLEEIKAQ